MPKNRQSNKLIKHPRILILCEGKETEPNYFHSLKADIQKFNSKISGVTIEDTKVNTLKELVDIAVDRKKATPRNNKFKSIWIVVDKDGYTKHPESFNRAKANQINIAFSSISFEYWFLLHFEYTTRPFTNCDELEHHLKHKQYLPNYDKGGNYYHLLKDKTKTAIQHAIRVQEHWQFDLDRGTPLYNLNPYTDVDKLISFLLYNI